MNILTEKLYNKIEIDGVNYSVNPSFSLYIRANLLINNKDSTNNDLLNLMLEFCPNFKFNGDNFTYFFSEMMDFYNSSGEKLNIMNNEDDKSKVIDFEMDKNTIFADFKREYGINLAREDLHVHEFLALLSGLSNESGLKQRIHYRIAELGKLKGEERKRYEELKSLYKIGGKKEMEEAEAWLLAEDERIEKLKRERKNINTY